MPIEFLCSQCGKQLRTPDETAGKQAKCPQCGAIMEIPRFSSLAPLATPVVPPASPFGPAPQPQGQQDWNPYASPNVGGQSAALSIAPSGDLVHTRVDMGQAFASIWTIFKANLSLCLLAGLTLVVIQVVVGGIQNGITSVLGGEINFGRGVPRVDVGAAIAGQLVTQLIGWIFGTWLQLGATNCFLKVARGQPASVGDVFSGGPFLWRGMLINVIFLIVGLLGGVFSVVALSAAQNIFAFFAVAFAFGVVSTILYLSVALSFQLVIDRNMGAWDAITKSMAFMSGNRLMLFLMLLIVGILGGLFMIVTCLIGTIAVIPYFYLLQVVFYLQATGQPTADRMSASH